MFIKLSYSPGGIQYYSFKPIALGQELLVFYGDSYFVELGYNIDTDITPGENMLLNCGIICSLEGVLLLKYYIYDVKLVPRLCQIIGLQIFQRTF